MWVYFSNDGFTFLEISGLAFFLAIFAVWFWLIPYLYSSVIATESGLEAPFWLEWIIN